MNNKLYKIIVGLTIAGLILPSFGLAQDGFGTAMPQTPGETKDLIMSILTMLPRAVKGVWEQEALPIWEKMWGKFLEYWNRTAEPLIEPWWQKFLGLLGKEIEKRRPDIEQQFLEEKEEMQKDLWERFKNILSHSI